LAQVPIKKANRQGAYQYPETLLETVKCISYVAPRLHVN
jgi:hypothetical protein